MDFDAMMDLSGSTTDHNAYGHTITSEVVLPLLSEISSSDLLDLGSQPLSFGEPCLSLNHDDPWCWDSWPLHEPSAILEDVSRDIFDQFLIDNLVDQSQSWENAITSLVPMDLVLSESSQLLPSLSLDAACGSLASAMREEVSWDMIDQSLDNRSMDHSQSCEKASTSLFPMNPPPSGPSQPLPSLPHDAACGSIAHRQIEASTISQLETQEQFGNRFAITGRTRELLQNSLQQQPYPAKEDLERLARQTNLTANQVRTWFNNSRSRLLKKERMKSKMQKRVPRTELTVNNLEHSSGRDSMSSPVIMERFMDSPLEEYPVSWSVLVKAAAEVCNEDCPYTPVTESSRSSSVHSGVESTSSASSTSNRSSTSFSSRASRKGRRAYAVPIVSFKRPNQPPAKPHRYFCTFCPKGFVGRYEWNRHEESVHLPRTLWICNFDDTGDLASEALVSSETNLEATSDTILQFIVSNPGEPHPDLSPPRTVSSVESNSNTQAITRLDCTCRSLQDRTFYRRDHLVQHIRLSHSTNCLKYNNVQSCKTVAEPLASTDLALRCGFCGFRASTWEERCSHLSLHFARGVDMSVWWLQRRDNALRSSFPNQQMGISQIKVCPSCDAEFTQLHSCQVWSCSFLATPKFAMDNVRSLQGVWSQCRYCDEPFGLDWALQVSHLVEHHKYRSCEQKRYSSKESFLEHLVDEHHAWAPNSRREDLLNACKSFLRETGLGAVS